MKRLQLFLLVTGFIISATSSLVSAAPPPSSHPKGLTVSPAIEQITLNASQTSASFTVTLTNNTNHPVVVDLAPHDFKALDQTGGIGILGGVNYNAATNPHGLSYWMSLSTKQLNLAPGASQPVVVSVNNVALLQAGGHYGVLTYSIGSPGLSKTGARVGVNQVVGTLIFLTTAGGGTQYIRLSAVNGDPINFRIPSLVNLVFTNTGNTQSVPRGTVSIVGPFSKRVAFGIINVNSGLVLPGSSRLYQVSLNKASTWLLPGIYHTHITYQINGSQKTTTSDSTFFYINPYMLLIALVVIIILYVLFHRFKRHRHSSKTAKS